MRSGGRFSLRKGQTRSLRRVPVPGEGTLQKAATFVAAFGIGVAGYIAIEAAGGDAPTCIAGSSGCETVASSSYSHLLGVNIAVMVVAKQM